MSEMTRSIEVLVAEGCPSMAEALALAQSVASRLAPAAVVERVDVWSDDQARGLGFLGSPSIRVDGEDVEGLEGPPVGLACRLYAGRGGAPPEWMVEAALLRALGPRRVLFLCRGNSARSQMAEAMARALAPEGVTVASAGSHPVPVWPEVPAVLAEIGIDGRELRSKGIAALVARPFDVVVSLCAEELCPLWLGESLRVSWPLEDPAAATGPDRTAAFRRVRDELYPRLELLFRPRGSAASA